MSITTFIPIDIKVIEVHAPAIARASGHQVTHIIGALSLLWHRVFSTKQEVVPRISLAGVFGPDNLDTIIEACVAEGFLTPVDEGWRVRGADHFKRVADARSRGGKAASGNLKRGAVQPGKFPGSLPAQAGDQPGTSRDTAPGSIPALYPRSEIRDPKNYYDDDVREPPAQVVRLPSPAPVEPEKRHDSGSAYLAFLNAERLEAGLVPEMGIHPGKWDAWFSEAMGELNGDGERLDAAVAAFSRDPYWRERQLPLRGFMSQWRKYVPQARQRGAS